MINMCDDSDIAEGDIALRHRGGVCGFFRLSARGSTIFLDISHFSPANSKIYIVKRYEVSCLREQS